MSPGAPGSILVSLLLPIGDTLFATPALHALRAAYPLAHITALTYPNNSGILAANADVDRIWHWPTRQRPLGARKIAGLCADLRGERFDLVVQFSTYNYWLYLWTGARRHASLKLPLLWWIRPGAGRRWRTLHAVQHYANVVRKLGIHVRDWRLRMEPTPEDTAAVDQLLARSGIGPGERLLGIHPGGEGMWGRKKWPVERFAAVADGLHARFGDCPVVLGGKDDLALADRLASLAGSPVTNLAGATTLGETAALARRCEIFVGNDSSPLHITAAMGTPVVGIYGVTDPTAYGPWVPGGRPGVDYAVARPRDGCGCCFPLIGGITLPALFRCLACDALKRITPEQVLDAAAALLESGRAAGSGPDA